MPDTSIYATPTATVIKRVADRCRDALPSGVAVRRFDGSALDAILAGIAVLQTPSAATPSAWQRTGLLVGFQSDAAAARDAAASARSRTLDLALVVVTLRTPVSAPDRDPFGDVDAERLDEAMDTLETALHIRYLEGSETPASVFGAGVTHVEVVGRAGLESAADWYARALTVRVTRDLARPTPAP